MDDANDFHYDSSDQDFSDGDDEDYVYGGDINPTKVILLGKCYAQVHK